jgi:Kef-type K+ transport system membrane component KefB
VVILTATVWIILSINKKAERAIQTLTAFYGTSVLMQLVVWPFRTWLLSMGEDVQQQASLPLLAVIALAIWSFVVMVHIYRNALDSSRGKAILISIITQMVVGLSMLTLFANELQQELAK